MADAGSSKDCGVGGGLVGMFALVEPSGVWGSTEGIGGEGSLGGGEVGILPAEGVRSLEGGAKGLVGLGF